MKRLLLLVPLVFVYNLAFNQVFGEGCGYIPKDLRSTTTAAGFEKIKMTPSVINFNAVGNVLFEAFVTGTASRVSLFIDSKANDFNDIGIKGDKKAGDNIYTLEYPAAAILSRLKDTDVYRPFLGFVELYEAGIKILQGSVFPCVRTPEISVVNIVKKAADVQTTGRVFNLVSPNGDCVQLAPLAKRFYQFYGDNFDFIHFVRIPGYIGNRYHFSVQNTVQGIGLNQFNSSTEYGSKGVLKGISVFPILGLYDGASVAYIHEVGHQWINFLQNTPFKPAVPHWPSSSNAIGVMGISIGGAGGAGGQFNKKLLPENGGYKLSEETEPAVFNLWELYLMGLISKSEIVNPALIFKDQNVYPANGFYPESDFTTYTINQMIGANGDRIPSNIGSQKKFRIATIVLSDELLNPAEMAYLDHMTA